MTACHNKYRLTKCRRNRVKPDVRFYVRDFGCDIDISWARGEWGEWNGGESVGVSALRRRAWSRSPSRELRSTRKRQRFAEADLRGRRRFCVAEGTGRRLPGRELRRARKRQRCRRGGFEVASTFVRGGGGDGIRVGQGIVDGADSAAGVVPNEVHVVAVDGEALADVFLDRGA